MLDYDNFTNKKISLGKSCYENNQLYSHRLGSIWNRSIFLLDWESTKKREYWIACCHVGAIQKFERKFYQVIFLSSPHVNAGYIAMIPERSIKVEGWSGQGWMILDEETGAADYMICGGLQGETTMVNGGSC